MAFVSNIEDDTIRNRNFRKVVFTSSNPKGMQMTLMTLKPKEEIGMEIHPHTDQFLRIEKGKGVLVIGKEGDEIYDIADGTGIIIPAGTWHNVINEDSRSHLKLYSIYTPPEHKKGLVQKTKPKKD